MILREWSSSAWTFEKMTGLLKRAGVCLECGSRHLYHGECLDCIIREDKATRWPNAAKETGNA